MVLRLVRSVVVLFLFLGVNLATYGMGEFGGVWVDTLEFFHKGLRLKTGPQGNVRYINGKSFNVNDIHTDLQKEAARVAQATGKSHNVVVGGLSLFIRTKNGSYESFYLPLKEESSTLAFVSGTTERGYSQQGTTFICPSDQYMPSLLLEKFGQRIPKEQVDQKENDSFSPLNHDAIRKYYEAWKESQKRVLEAAREETKRLASKSFDSVYSFHKILEGALEEKIDEANKNFGSSIDSEQFLIHFFEKTKTVLENEVQNVVAKYNDLLGRYRTDKLRSLIAGFSKEATSLGDDVGSIKKKTGQLQQSLDDFEGIQEIGCVLHLHSTNEICCCCGYSLAQEIRHGILSKLTEIIKSHNESQSSISPFFSVLVSSSKVLTQVKDNRPGIGKESTFRGVEDGAVPLEFALEKGVFMQKLFSENK